MGTMYDRIDFDRVNVGPVEVPNENTSRIETGVNIYWAGENPELFGRSIIKTLIACPPDQWDIRIKAAYMPGETWSVVATPKKHPNGQRMFTVDGTMLDEHGNRSIFDDVDE